LHLKTGIGICSTKWNSETPKTVITVARMKQPFHVALRSPSEATKTHAHVAGARPPMAPNRMNANGLARMHAQANHCGSAGSRSSSSPPGTGVAGAAVGAPGPDKITPSGGGGKPGARGHHGPRW